MGAMLLITCAYIMIALQFRGLYKLSRSNIKSAAAKAMIYLSLIFVLCAFSGYVSHFIPFYPDWLSHLTHYLLAILSWVFVATNQARHIVLFFDDDIHKEGGE